MDRLKYAKKIVYTLSSTLNLDISVEELSREKEETYYSLLHKKAIRNGEITTVISGIIYLNFSKLTTKLLIDKAIAHEMSHLIPHTNSFTEAWKLWRSIVREVSKSVLVRET